ncbi:trihelix transcription factor ASIL2 [Euphorbia lathyris]|uniref:trihelix transcription factor ASIL2 n=1 Tax=Euphorbia lathyris TaxID=212925 RepID=UPI0033132865
MDKETNQVISSLPLTTNSIKLEESSSRKNLTGAGGGFGGGGDRLKRDEWSEGAVSSLLEAYESKWILRNRAKLKGHDWEDVARYVSNRANCSKSPKTQTQCKNKIESMKKRYRSESAAADGSSWPLYPRLDLLLRGSGGVGGGGSAGGAMASPSSAAALSPAVVHQVQQPQPPPPPLPSIAPSPSHPPLILLETTHVVPQPPTPQPLVLPLPLPLPVPPPPPPAAPPPAVIMTAQNSHESNGVDRGPKEDGYGTKLSDHVTSDKNPTVMETDSSTPALYSEKEKVRSNSKKMKMKMDQKTMKNKRSSSTRTRREEWEIADSIRWLAEVVVRSEQARMDTMRELEKMRMEAEARRAELDLKRTEIMANTQLEIAKLFAGVGKSIDSSLRIGRN